MTLRTKKRHKMARLPPEPWTVDETGDGNVGIWLPGSDVDMECDIHITALDREVQESMARAILKLPTLLTVTQTLLFYMEADLVSGQHADRRTSIEGEIRALHNLLDSINGKNEKKA